MKPYLALVTLFMVCACASITVDEAFVFRPQPDPNATTIAEDLTIEWEAAFTGEEPVDIEIEAWSNQRVSIMLNEDELVPADVRHGFLPTNTDPIAYTLVKKDNADRPLFVHCGGNTASRRTSGTPYALKLIDFGDVLLFDYPGYGDSPGKASPESLHTMNEAVATFTRELSTNQRPVIVWGHSLGGFVCANLAMELGQVDAIVFETSARNAKEVAGTVPPWFLKPFIRIHIAESLTKFDNVDTLAGFETPILVIGARQDRTLPVRLSQSLAADLEEAGHDVTYQEFADANHISVAAANGFQDHVLGFLDSAQIDARRSTP